MNQKQQEILNEIRVKMFYDPRKTLSEQETRFTRDLDKAFSTPEGAKEYFKNIEPYKHEMLMLGAFGSFFIPYIGIPMAITIDLMDAGLYAAEGDTYMTGLAILFSLIGLNQIPVLKRYSSKKILDTIKKARLNYKLTKEELQLIEDVVKNSKKIKNIALTNLIKKIVIKMPISKMVLLIAKLSKKYPIIYSIATLVFKIGGIIISYDALAKYFGIIPGDVSKSDEEKIKNIDKDEFNEVFNKYLLENQTKLNEKQLDSMVIFISQLPSDLSDK